MLATFTQLLRSLRRSPASAAAAVVTLSLTLGGGTAIFAIVEAVLLTPPPFTDPGSLVTLGETPPGDSASAPRPVAFSRFQAWRERAGSTAAIEGFDGTNLTLTGNGPAERLSATDVTPGFLRMLGVEPVLGRTFQPDDAGQRRVIVSHAFWRGRLGGDPAAVGRDLLLGGEPHTVIGVLPERFFFALNVGDLWRPIQLLPGDAERAGYRVFGIARLSPGVTPETLDGALDEVGRASTPAADAAVTPIGTASTGGSSGTLMLLAAGAAVAILIAFVNLAGLLIVRAIDRRRELAVRTALGARQSAIAGQLIAEAEALVVLGIAGGAWLAWWMTPWVARVTLEQFGGIATRGVSVSWRVVTLIAVTATLAAALGALAPAVAAVRRRVVDVLRRGTTASPRELAVRRVFVGCQVALAFVLLASLATVGRSLWGMLTVNPGFEARGVLVAQVALPPARYSTPERAAAFYMSLQEALNQRLGPGTTSIVDELPLTHDRGRSVVTPYASDSGREAVVRVATPAYFELMRIPLIDGRSFDNSDIRSAPVRAVIGRRAAGRLFPAGRAVGGEIWLAGPRLTAEVIGVVGDVAHRALDEPALDTVYLSGWQAPSNASHIVIRSARADADTLAIVREEVSRLDANLPVYRARPMSDVVAASPGVPVRRVLTAAFLGFAILAVVLGAVGLFGVVAHDVAARRGELALRVALGARPARILRATIGQGAAIVGYGVAAGILLSLWTTQGLGGAAVMPGRLDATSVIGAAAVLITAGVAAVLPAARRAARTDPMAALRGD